MKAFALFCAVASIFASLPSARAANPELSAFARDGKLYITRLDDGCNGLAPVLEVAPECDKHRVTRNLALACEAKLAFSSTMMACSGATPRARAMVVDLAETNVAPEARTLTLIWGNDRVVVKLQDSRENLPGYGAFVQDGKLYLTVIGDSCNRIVASIMPRPYCTIGRVTDNYARECEVDVSIAQTRMGCPGRERVAHVVVKDLVEAKVTREAETLLLHSVQGPVLEVPTGR